jgi:thiol-disulfide isomerase/thioredoxin
MKKQLLFLTLTAFLISCSGNKTSNAQAAEPETAVEAQDTKEENKAPEAPDFTLNDINGKPLTLSSLRGKYVVLDFWGSWCIWCIRGIPKMKEYYAKYADKMEILGIDCNDRVERWKAAVAEYQIPWLHVYNTDESHLLEKYGIEGFPTKVVVDPEGRIANVVVGEDPAFYAYLDELFQ